MSSLTYVRRAEPADANAIAAIISSAWQERYGTVWPEALWQQAEISQLRQEWADALTQSSREDVRAFVALTEATVVGCALWETRGDGVAELTMWEIHPDHRGHGHASRLIAAVADTATDAGVNELHWWATDHERPRAEFLAGMGWAPDGAQRTVEADGFTMHQARWLTTL